MSIVAGTPKNLVATVTVAATNLPDQTGPIEVAIRLEDPTSLDNGLYWSDTGGTWEALASFPGVNAWPTATWDSVAGEWTYSLPAVATAGRVGARVRVAMGDAVQAVGTTKSEAQELDITNGGDGVWYASALLGGAPGTAYPAGTREFPVSDEDDLFTILTSRVQDKIFVLTELTLTAARDYEGKEFIGASRRGTPNAGVVVNAALLDNTVWRELTLSGALASTSVDGDAAIACYHCTLAGVSNFYGHLDDCALGTHTPSRSAGFTSRRSSSAEDLDTVLDMSAIVVGGEGPFTYDGHDGTFSVINNTDGVNPSSVKISGPAMEVIADASNTEGSLEVIGGGHILDASGVNHTVIRNAFNDSATILVIPGDQVGADIRVSFLLLRGGQPVAAPTAFTLALLDQADADRGTATEVTAGVVLNAHGMYSVAFAPTGGALAQGDTLSALVTITDALGVVAQRVWGIAKA